MGWESSDRKARLPKNWNKIRESVLKRDGYRCVARDDSGRRCVNKATDVDHIMRGDNHARSNLQSLCAECHKVKTQAESQRALREARARAKYPRQQHPGLS